MITDEFAIIIADEYRRRELLFRWFQKEDGTIDFDAYQEAVDSMYIGEDND